MIHNGGCIALYLGMAVGRATIKIIPHLPILHLFIPPHRMMADPAHQNPFQHIPISRPALPDLPYFPVLFPDFLYFLERIPANDCRVCIFDDFPCIFFFFPPLFPGINGTVILSLLQIPGIRPVIKNPADCFLLP